MNTYTNWYTEVAALFEQIGVSVAEINWNLAAIFNEGLTPQEVLEDYNDTVITTVRHRR